MVFKWSRRDKDVKGTITRSARIVSEQGDDLGELTITTSKTTVDVNINLGKLLKLKHHKNQEQEQDDNE